MEKQRIGKRHKSSQIVSNRKDRKDKKAGPFASPVVVGVTAFLAVIGIGSLLIIFATPKGGKKAAVQLTFSPSAKEKVKVTEPAAPVSIKKSDELRSGYHRPTDEPGNIPQHYPAKIDRRTRRSTSTIHVRTALKVPGANAPV